MKKLLALLMVLVPMMTFAVAPASDSVSITSIVKTNSCGATTVTVSGTAEYNNTSRILRVKVDGVTVLEATNEPQNWGPTSASASLSVGQHTVTAEIFNNGGNSLNPQIIDSESVTVSSCDEPEDQTITVGTHAPASATYGESFVVAATSDSELPVVVSVDGECSVAGNTVTMTSGTGSCSVNFNQAGNDDFNPADEVTETVTAEKVEITATADQKAKVFGESDPTLTYQVTGELVGEDEFSGSIDREDGEDVGTYDIIVGTLSLDSSNYVLTFVGDDFIIGEKSINVTANAQTKVEGEVDPELTYNADDLEEGDSFSGALVRAEGETAGSYAITIGTLSAGSNYDINFTGATFTITALTEDPVLGCTDSEATNFNPEATQDDESCVYPEQPVDMCADVEGVQTEVPQGMSHDGVNCAFPADDTSGDDDALSGRHGGGQFNRGSQGSVLGAFTGSSTGDANIEALRAQLILLIQQLILQLQADLAAQQ